MACAHANARDSPDAVALDRPQDPEEGTSLEEAIRNQEHRERCSDEDLLDHSQVEGPSDPESQVCRDKADACYDYTCHYYHVSCSDAI